MRLKLETANEEEGDRVSKKAIQSVENARCFRIDRVTKIHVLQLAMSLERGRSESMEETDVEEREKDVRPLGDARPPTVLCTAKACDLMRALFKRH